VPEAWLWDVNGIARGGLGISADEMRARAAAEECMRLCGESTARLERGCPVIGMGALSIGYERSGQGWTGQVSDDGRITWSRLSGQKKRFAS
jgi:hypothetical protein